jgi:Gpi18-like mannosyltransferase
MNQDLQKAIEAAAANGGDQGPGAGFYVVVLLISVVMIAAMWKVFVKAGKPGWASLIPIYNLVVLLQIAGKPVWWIVLFLIPIVSLIVAILTYVALAERFGKGGGFAIGLVLLGPIFFPILGFGGAQYRPAVAKIAA